MLLVVDQQDPAASDLMTNCGSVTLCGEDEAMVRRDYELACLMEKEMPNELFTMRGDEEYDRNWFKELPDDMWLKPEEGAKKDATMIVEALEIGPEQALLDCPCGDCRVVVHIAATGCGYVGIDINANFIAKARERFQEAGLQGDLRLDILKNRPVVLILMSTVCVLVVENAGDFLLSLYFVEAMEFSLVEPRYLLIVLAVTTLVSSPPAGWYVDRSGARATNGRGRGLLWRDDRDGGRPAAWRSVVEDTAGDVRRHRV